MRRSTDDIIAEAKREEQDTPIKEPFELVLRSGHVVTFRNPGNIPTEQAADSGSSFAAQINALLASREDQRKFWKEWGKVEQRYIGGLVNAILDHYLGDDEVGKDSSSSS